jgi:hypothetical protein
MGFLGRGLAHSLTMALSLALGILAMQAPAFTREYAGALLQVASDARRDIDQREASARQYYGIDAADDDGILSALRSREPSNAETLERALERSRDLQRTYDAIEKNPVLLRPVVALGSALSDNKGYREPIWKLSLSTYGVQLDFSLGAVIYGLAGVVMGSLLAQLIILPFQSGMHRRHFSRSPR